MANLHPFNAIRYATPASATSTPDISSKIAPPYDVLDEQPKQQLLAADPNNIVAVDLPVTPPKTVGPDSAYQQAGQLMRQWLADATLTRDAQPALYAYQQTYTIGSTTHNRRGLLTALELEPFGRKGGGIHRHEHTIRSGTDDRYKLMEATAAQLSPVFAVFPDPDSTARNLLNTVFDTRTPDFTATTPNDNTQHSVWIIRDTPTIQSIQKLLEPRDIFIADGHHRYTTALNYQQAHPDNPLAKNGLLVLVPIEDPGLIVQATHRILCNVTDFNLDKLTDAIRADDRLAINPAPHSPDQLEQLVESLPTAGLNAFAFIDPVSNTAHIITSAQPDPLAKDLPDRSPAFRNLDVAIAHELFVDRILRPLFGGDSITFKYPQLPAVDKLLREEPNRLAFLLQPTPLQSVCDVAIAGDVMPPKSTFFFPKMATGLVINPLTPAD